MTELMEALKFAKGLDPVADAFDGASPGITDIVSMRDYGRALFVVHYGVGVTGTQTFKVDACDDVSASNVVKVPFWYREILTGDTEGAIARAVAADGFTVTAGSSKIVLVEVDAKDLPDGYPFVRLLQTAEPVNSPCLAGVSIILGGKPTRYAGASKATVLA